MRPSTILLGLPFILPTLCVAQRGGIGGRRLPGSDDPHSTQPQNPAQSSAAAARAAANAAEASAQAHSNANGISYGEPNPKLPDPCGPPFQPPGPAESISTCHKDISVADVGAHTSYGVNCWNDTSKPALDVQSCEDSVYVLCNDISGGDPLYTVTNKWVWSSGGNGEKSKGEKCNFGFWLPEGGAPAPSRDRCVEQILHPMVNSCGESGTYNVGSVNVASDGLPKGLETGIVNGAADVVPVDDKYPAYVMIPLEIPYGINGE